MLVTPYLVGRDLDSDQLALITDCEIPAADAETVINYSVMQRIDNDVLGMTLYIHYTDVESGAHLVDIALVGLPDDVVQAFDDNVSVIVRSHECMTGVELTKDKQLLAEEN